ncbi:MAG: hypothetical protein KDA22_13690 [Phycisphaerales bacterium]|nr:hypothetical protein [Phycisphaerales bacterium]
MNETNTNPHREPVVTAIHRRVERLRRGEEPGLVARLTSGWAVMGTRQVVPGYCLLLPDPVVASLNDLPGAARSAFLDDMARLGDAVLAATGCARINYEILGNLEPALHAHIVPRRLAEPDDLRTRPIWFFDWEAAPVFDPSIHGALVASIREGLGHGRSRSDGDR